MSATKTRKVNSLLKARYGIDDPQLSMEIVMVVLTRDDDAPSKWSHPAIVCAKKVTGQNVPAGLVDEVIAKLGGAPDEARARSLYVAQAKRGYPQAWYWLDDYAGTSKSAPKSAPSQAVITSVTEWK